MTGDPIRVYRVELRSAAARRASAFQRRRRRVVALAVAVGAVLMVGAAIAAQTRWLDSGSRIKPRYTAAGRAAAFGYLGRGYSFECMAAPGQRGVGIHVVGWTSGLNAAATLACKSELDAIAAICRVPQHPGEEVTPAMAAACRSELRQRAADPR